MLARVLLPLFPLTLRAPQPITRRGNKMPSMKVILVTLLIAVVAVLILVPVSGTRLAGIMRPTARP